MSAWKKITKTEPEEMRDVLVRDEASVMVGCLLGRTNGDEWEGWPYIHPPTEWAEIPE